MTYLPPMPRHTRQAIVRLSRRARHMGTLAVNAPSAEARINARRDRANTLAQIDAILSEMSEVTI